MKRIISSILSSIFLITVFTDCSKKVDPLPSPAMMEGYTWKIRKHIFIYGGVENEYNQNNCFKSLKWSFKNGLLTIVDETGCKSDSRYRLYNNMKFEITDNKIVFVNLVNTISIDKYLYETYALSFSGDEMTWLSEVPSSLGEAGSKIVFVKQ